jgi:hypothetical protein
MSDEERAAYKAQKVREIRDYNKDIIEDLGISTYDFNMKSPFKDDSGRIVVGIFASEFKKPKGFFFELIDSSLNPTDPDRKVYRIAPNNSFHEEFELNEKGSYLVPLEEIRCAHPSSIALNKLGAFTNVEDVFKITRAAQIEATNTNIPKAPAPMEDAPYSDMTIRDYYAIHTGKPVSAKAWLNDLIKNK